MSVHMANLFSLLENILSSEYTALIVGRWASGCILPVLPVNCTAPDILLCVFWCTGQQLFKGLCLGAFACWGFDRDTFNLLGDVKLSAKRKQLFAFPPVGTTAC